MLHTATRTGVVCGLLALVLVGAARGQTPPAATPSTEPNPPPAYPPPAYPPPAYPPPAYPPPAYPPPSYLPPPAVRAPTLIRYEERPRYGLIIAGACVFGVPYMINAMVGWIAGEGMLAIPVAGPLVEIGYCRDCTGATPAGRTLVAFLVFDAIVQGAGVAMLVAGAVSHERVAVRESARLLILPTPLQNGAGVAAIGRF